MHIFTAVKFNFSTLLIGMFLAALIGYFIGYFLRKLISQYQVKEFEARKEKIIGEAEQEAHARSKAELQTMLEELEGSNQVALAGAQKTSYEVEQLTAERDDLAIRNSEVISCHGWPSIFGTNRKHSCLCSSRPSQATQ